MERTELPPLDGEPEYRLFGVVGETPGPRWEPERSFAAGEQIIEDGSTGNALYILATGAVEVLKGGRPIEGLVE